MAISLRHPRRVVLSAARARQGRYGRPVLWVLLVSTALAALTLFGAWTWRAPDLAASGSRATASRADFQDPGFNPTQPPSQQP